MGQDLMLRVGFMFITLLNIFIIKFNIGNKKQSANQVCQKLINKQKKV